MALSSYSSNQTTANSFSTGPKPSNLQSAKMAMALQKKLKFPPKVRENNLEKARWALRGKKKENSYGYIDPKMLKDLDYGINIPSGKFIKTATEEMIRDQKLYMQEYAAQWNGEPWNGSTARDEDYRKLVMDRTLNMAYEQRKNAVYPIYKADTGVIQPQNLIKGFIPWEGNSRKKRKGPF